MSNACSILIAKTIIGDGGSWRGIDDCRALQCFVVLFTSVMTSLMSGGRRHRCICTASPRRTGSQALHPKRDRGDFRTPTLRQNKWGRFYPCKRLSIVARWLLVGLFFVQGFLQFPLCLQIELLVPALGLTGLLPKFIRAADNIYSGRPCHDRFPYSSS